jgi:hypothetical protein
VTTAPGDQAPVFISHVPAETGWAGRAAAHLEVAGHRVLLDVGEWALKVRELPGIVVVALWSRAYFESGAATATMWELFRRSPAIRLVCLRVEEM